MERFITFLEPWGKRSWKVTFDGPYENDRFPHVEVGEENMNKHVAGEKHALSNLHASGKALMWDVADCVNSLSRDKRAHFTVYFGADARQKISAFQ